MSVNNRILLSSPCYSKVDPEILEDWMALAYHCGRRMPEYEFFLGIKSKTEQFRARNAIVEAAQQHNCDRILMLDDDMVIDPFKRGHESYDFLKKLIAHDKDICGALYYQRGGDCEPVLMARLNEKGYRFLRDDEITHKLQEVDVAGGGCLLIKTRVFDRIPYPYFKPEHQYGTDVQLCRQAKEKGFTVWADTSIELGHIMNAKTVITSANRHQFQNEGIDGAGQRRTFVVSDLYGRLIEDAIEYTGKESVDEMTHVAGAFLELRRESGLSDPDWYREFPTERVCRQVWFNTEDASKKMLTQGILTSIPHHEPLRILDFGCGIGVTALALAEKGHRVTAMDIRGTGTFEFLKWRAAKHGAAVRFWETDGGAPALGDEQFDIIIATDSIEHIKEWKLAVHHLAQHLCPGGVLFSNNGVLDDMTQPEHYPCKPKDFIAQCVESNLMPLNRFAYVKNQEEVVHA